MLKYPPVSQQANATRQQAADIAENRTFPYQQIHAKQPLFEHLNICFSNLFRFRISNFGFTKKTSCATVEQNTQPDGLIYPD
jgi:hypothetical protein